MFALSTFLPYRLAVLSERISRRLAVEYEALHGLSLAEWRVLVHLQRCGKVSIREIHDCVNLEKPRVSRAVSRLEGQGLVEKVPAPDDGRLVAISLTPTGQQALNRIVPAVQAVEARLLAALTPAEQAAFLDMLERMHAVLDADPAARSRSRMDVTTPLDGGRTTEDA